MVSTIPAGAPPSTGKRAKPARTPAWGLTLILPINRYNSVKLYGSTGVYTKTGTDFDLVGVVWQFRGAEDFRVELLVAARENSKPNANCHQPW